MSVVTANSRAQQRAAALTRANEIRTLRAQLKRDIRAGRKHAADQILDPPEWLLTATVIEVLLATPKVGRVKAVRMLRGAGVTAGRSFGSLTERQRVELAQLVRMGQPLGYGRASAPCAGSPPRRVAEEVKL